MLLPVSFVRHGRGEFWRNATAASWRHIPKLVYTEIKRIYGLLTWNWSNWSNETPSLGRKVANLAGSVFWYSRGRWGITLFNLYKIISQVSMSASLFLTAKLAQMQDGWLLKLPETLLLKILIFTQNRGAKIADRSRVSVQRSLSMGVMQN